MFELRCLALRKDCKMYKDRIEAILQQMEEVAVERDQVGASLLESVAGPLPGPVASGAGASGGGQLCECFFFVFFLLLVYFERA